MFFEPQNFAFIAQLRLKTIINLSLEATGGKLAAFARAQGAKLVHLGFKLWRDDDSWSPVSVELVKECIEMALRGANQPCLLMCASGHHQAGVIVACMRRCMKWSFSAIVDEFRRFADKPKSIYSTLQFVENFDPGLVTVKPATARHCSIQSLFNLVILATRKRAPRLHMSSRRQMRTHSLALGPNLASKSQ